MKIIKVEYKNQPDSIIRKSENKFWVEELAWLNGEAWFNTERRLSEVNDVVRHYFDEINSRLSVPNAFYANESNHGLYNTFTHTYCKFPYKNEKALFFMADIFSLSIPVDYIEYIDDDGNERTAYTPKQMAEVMRNVT